MPPKKKAAPSTPRSSKDDSAALGVAYSADEAAKAYDELAEKYEALREHMDRRPSVSVNIGKLRCTYYLPPGHPLIAIMEQAIAATPTDSAGQFEQMLSAPDIPSAPIGAPDSFENQLAEGFTPPPMAEVNAVFPDSAPPAPELPAPLTARQIVTNPHPTGDTYPLPCFKCGNTQLIVRTGAHGEFATCPNCPSDKNPNFSTIVTAKDYWLQVKYKGKACPLDGGTLTYMHVKDSGKPPFIGCANYKSKGCKFMQPVPLLLPPQQ